MRAAYVGSHASHLQVNLNINNSTYIPGSTLGTDARRRFTNYGNIFLGSQEGNSSYHSLQLSAIRRFSGGPRLLDGLTLLANYTFSKSIDDLTSGMQQQTLAPAAIRRCRTISPDAPASTAVLPSSIIRICLSSPTCGSFPFPLPPAGWSAQLSADGRSPESSMRKPAAL